MVSERKALPSLLDNIEVVPFKHKHLYLLIEMLEGQNYPDIKSISFKTLPKIGYIALLDKQPIAAGFLRRIEGDIVAQIDGLTSNPFFGSIIRHHGINKILECLINDAKELKLKGLMAFTVDSSILVRAEAMGFRKVAHSILTLPF